MTGQELDSDASHAHLAMVMQGPSGLKDHSSGLEQGLRRFWETESIGIVEHPEVNLTKEPFPAQIKYDFIQGRYKVGLPWKLVRPESSNYNLCVSQLMKLRSRLQRREALWAEYDKIFQTQLQTGIIEPVPQSEWNSRGVHFLSHHGVVPEDKDTFFDGSAKAETQYH